MQSRKINRQIVEFIYITAVIARQWTLSG